MTDKQIIINKMDKPKRYCEGIDCASCNEKEPCIYKIANELEEKLLRKEQECEELRQYHNKCCEEFENEKQNLIDKYNQFSKDFFIGKYCKKEYCDLLKAKEQECEELKEDIERWKSNFNGKVSAIEELLQQLDQFKVKNIKNSKTLTEIKEIAEKQVKRSPDGETFSRPEIKQILQKISEVENE